MKIEMIEEPFYTYIIDNQIFKASKIEEVKLSHLKSYFKNEEVRSKMEMENNRVVYTVYRVETPSKVGELLFCLTVIEPGEVDGELFMTRGHYHLDEDCAEVYLGVKGKGVILMQKFEMTKVIEMNPNFIVYIPGGWGHRSINISLSEPFVFFSVWPAHSGYDYKKILKYPFTSRVYYREDKYVIMG
jgi:glucose-6-phosphate isomerase